MAGWLSGCVAGWLSGWMAGWLAGWLGGWVAGVAGWLGGSVAGWLGDWVAWFFGSWVADCIHSVHATVRVNIVVLQCRVKQSYTYNKYKSSELELIRPVEEGIGKGTSKGREGKGMEDFMFFEQLN